jgi:predicted ATPase/DNA-binding SARP family transcriptional activator
MLFRVLGSLAVEHEGRPLALGGRKQRALLALLLLHANEVVSRDVLVDELWGGEPPRSALHSLEVYVSRLRKVVGERLQTRPAGYMLELEPAELDVQCFEDLLAKGRAALRAGEATTAAEFLREALALWRGRPFEDVAYEPFVQVEAARLEELQLACLEERIEADLARGEHAGLVAELESLVARHPLRERVCEQLMLALYRSGRQVEALRVYRDARRRLVEVGVEPSQALRRLEQAILQQNALLEAPRVASARTRAPEPPATEFVGRAADIAAASDLLARDEVRLLTLTGPGGVGKTRLALEVVRARAGDFDGGVVFVPLAAAADADLVPTVIAEALGIRELKKRPLPEQLVEHVAAGKLLLVLDNFEHVLAAAPFVSALVAASDRVKVLVTSRAALRVSGEHELEVRPLPEEDAVRLFNLRARAVLADFDATNAVPAICRRLDGLPLAIELAAARVRVLTVPALLARLDRRLALLSAGGRDTPARHQTLRATIDWSYQLLDDDERRLSRRLSVFPGGCTLEAAEEVASAELDTLQSLVEKSLVRFSAERYWMLETIREFAAERLGSGEADAVIRRLRAHVVRLAEASAEKMNTAEEGAVSARLEPEYPNIRAAAVHALGAGEPDDVGWILGAVYAFLISRGHLREALEWVETALAARDRLSPDALAETLVAGGELARFAGDLRRAIELKQELVSADRKTRRPNWKAATLIDLGEIALDQGDFALARQYAEEGAAAGGGARPFLCFAELALRLGDLGSAESHALTALGGLEQGAFNYACGLEILAETARRSGDDARARELFREALTSFAKLGDGGGIADSLDGLARVAAAEGEADRAGRLHGAAERLRDIRGRRPARSDVPPSDAPASARDEGRTLSLEDAVDYALAGELRPARAECEQATSDAANP